VRPVHFGDARAHAAAAAARSPNPVHTQPLSERVYAMDVRHPLLVVGTADRAITVFNLNNPGTPYKQLASPLKYQTRQGAFEVMAPVVAVGTNRIHLVLFGT
jgi:uncharacterized protein YigE (DUF2233 family)